MSPHASQRTHPLRHLVLILGDQLDEFAPVWSDFDPSRDAVWMAEVDEESTHVISSKQRTAVFLSAMRHFAQRLRDRGHEVHYSLIDAPDNTGTLAGELQRMLRADPPAKVVMTAPGDWRVWQALRAVTRECGVALEARDDTHFFSTVREFTEHLQSRKQLRLEFFYREMRTKTGILMANGKPVGGQWNFDIDNRASFGKKGPGPLPSPARFAPDEITRKVIDTVNRRFSHHPGSLDSFAWPVTREQALQALQAFIDERLPHFGTYQDALWEGEVWLYHSHLSSALNLKLLRPHEVVKAAQDAYERGHAPLPGVEGFIRQILGWREYVRGIYWTQMPQYATLNAWQAHHPLPDFYWTAQTDMACLRDAIHQTLTQGYAHHIQRLMVTGLYAQLLGVSPQDVHRWYLGMYVDAVEWVELPNTLGMSQHADGGLMASKPYVASGKYIDRMSNHCKGCRYRPDLATGDQACPFTTLYWDFLGRHEPTLSANPRMVMQLKNLRRLSADQRQAIAHQADRLRTAAS